MTRWASRFTVHQEDPVTSRSDRTQDIKVKRRLSSLWVKLPYVLPLLITMAFYVRSRKMLVSPWHGACSGYGWKRQT